MSDCQHSADGKLIDTKNQSNYKFRKMAEKEMINDEHSASPEQELKQEGDSQQNDESTNPDSSTKSDLSKEERLELEVQELKDKYLRLYSEFDNYRRRTAKERLELIKTASEDVLRDIISVVDDFERAYKAHEKEEDAEKVRNGNQLVFQKLIKILDNKGLKVMDDLIGKPFDPETQEAITQIPAPNEKMRGKVVDVVEKGYTLGDKVVRYAKVVTGA